MPCTFSGFLEIEKAHGRQRMPCRCNPRVKMLPMGPSSELHVQRRLILDYDVVFEGSV